MFKKILVDCHAEIELPRNRFMRNMEDIASDLEYEAKDLQAFIRDHRSRDSYDISIIREYKNYCEYCHAEESTALDSNSIPCCCNKALKDYEASHKVTVLVE
jgi:hypothetical protein